MKIMFQTKRIFFAGSGLILVGICSYVVFHSPKQVCTTPYDPSGKIQKVCTIQEFSIYQRIRLNLNDFFYPDEECFVNTETGKISCRAIILGGCDQTATTTDCSRITNTPPPPPIAISTTSANPVQTGKIDEHLTIDNTLRDVNFCGEIYRVKQVIIDGVDVVQRIAELTAEMSRTTEQEDRLSKAVCGNIRFGSTLELNAADPKILGALDVYVSMIRNNNSIVSSYLIGIGRFIIFEIDYPSLLIQMSKSEEGSSIVIGTLK